MSLSCDCGYRDDYDGYYHQPYDFQRLLSSRRKRCCSCKKWVDPGDLCLEFSRYRTSKCDIEDRIYGEEVPLAPWYMCERCGEIFLNLSDIGYCFTLPEDMEDCLKDYWEITGFKK